MILVRPSEGWYSCAVHGITRIAMKLFAFSFLILALAADAANWPAWRGPHHDGTCDETGLPVTWSVPDKKNIAWAVELPDRGNSTPVVWGGKVFITQSIAKEKRRELRCFDAKTGALLWASGITFTDAEPTHDTNPHCSGSPATDGERVVVSFASAGVYCYDFGGRELWHRSLGEQHHIWGGGPSPVIVGDVVFLNHGPGKNARLVAMDKKTGAILWERAEPIRTDALPSNPDYYGSWSDPVPTAAGPLLMSWPFRVCAIDPANGKDLWTCEGLNPLVYTSPVLSEGIVVSMGGFSGKALAVKVGGTGDVTATHRLWHQPKSPQRIGSGAISGGHLFILNDPGIAQCIDIQTGEERWSQRLAGKGGTGQNWSSIVISEGKCYAVNQGGDAFVFKASPTFELLATNPMAEKVIGSIAVSEGRLFIRGHRHLFCIEGK